MIFKPYIYNPVLTSYKKYLSKSEMVFGSILKQYILEKLKCINKYANISIINMSYIYYIGFRSILIEMTLDF